jgi:hypothetical protein
MSAEMQDQWDAVLRQLLARSAESRTALAVGGFGRLLEQLVRHFVR